MENRAVWLHGPGKVPTVDSASMPEPGPGELVVHVKAVPAQPADWKIQAGIIPIPLNYPAIIGTLLAGIVEKTGAGVTRFVPGDRVAGNSAALLKLDSRFGADQRFALVPQELASKIGDTPFEVAASLSTGYVAISAMFLHLGLERPSSIDDTPKKNEKVLIWGVSSSFGSFAAQISVVAGYTVVGVASGRNAQLVKSLGVAHFADRTAASVVDDIVALGPFKAVLAAADDAADQVKLGAALARLGGGHFLSTMGVRPGVTLPDGVTGEFKQFLDDYLEPKNKEFTTWAWWDFFEKIYATKAIKSLPVEVIGGLSKLPEAWDMLRHEKISGKRIVVNPDLD